MRELGIFAWFGYELPLQESLHLIRASGFDRVMLWWGGIRGGHPAEGTAGTCPADGAGNRKRPCSLRRL